MYIWPCSRFSFWCEITRKKNEKTPETMSAMSDFEMEDPDASKTQVTTGPFLESPDN